jgi:hypothetical protein
MFLLFISSLLMAEEVKVLEDKANYFKVSVPKNWHVTESKDKSKVLRFSAISNDAKTIVQFYSKKMKVEVDDLPVMHKKLFANLGKLKEENIIREKFVLKNGMEMLNDKNSKGYYAFTHYEVEQGYLYIIQTMSKSDDFRSSVQIIKSLTIELPNSDTFSYVVQWIIGLIVGLIFILMLRSIGKIGHSIKLAKETKAIIKKSTLTGEPINIELAQKYMDKGKRAWMILLIGLLVIAIGAYAFLPLTKALSFVGANLLIVILGYFGLLFGPDIEGMITPDI